MTRLLGLMGSTTRFTVKWRLGMERRFKTYLFEYEFDGAKWGFEIKAASQGEAVRRVRTLSSQALFTGTLAAKIPVVSGLGLLPRILCGIGNLFSFLKRQ